MKLIVLLVYITAVTCTQLATNLREIRDRVPIHTFDRKAISYNKFLDELNQNSAINTHTKLFASGLKIPTLGQLDGKINLLPNNNMKMLIRDGDKLKYGASTGGMVRTGLLGNGQHLKPFGLNPGDLDRVSPFPSKWTQDVPAASKLAQGLAAESETGKKSIGLLNLKQAQSKTPVVLEVLKKEPGKKVVVPSNNVVAKPALPGFVTKKPRIPVLAAEVKPGPVKKLVIPANIGKKLEKETASLPVEIVKPSVEIKKAALPVEIVKPASLPVEIKKTDLPVEIVKPASLPVEIKKPASLPVEIKKAEQVKKLIIPADFSKKLETRLPTESSKEQLLANLLKVDSSVPKDELLTKPIFPANLLNDIVKNPTLLAESKPAPIKKPLSANLQKEIIKQPILSKSKPAKNLIVPPTPKKDQFEIIKHETSKNNEPIAMVDLIAQKPAIPEYLNMDHHKQPSSLKKDPVKPIDSKKKSFRDRFRTKKSKDKIRTKKSKESIPSDNLEDFEQISFDHSDKIHDDWVFSNKDREIELAPVKAKEVIPGEPGEFEDVELNSVHSTRPIAEDAVDKDGWEVV